MTDPKTVPDRRAAMKRLLSAGLAASLGGLPPAIARARGRGRPSSSREARSTDATGVRRTRGRPRPRPGTRRRGEGGTEVDARFFRTGRFMT